jgi:pyruvate/2-oxoglutarate dehydrogenase complex dihydrolipoamide dehydrogenase (E3) component
MHMPAIDRYDLVVVGSGEAGKYLAWTLSKAGNRTVMIERRLVGGSCPNVACLPSKNIIHSAKVASFVARASEFGLGVGSTATNMRTVQRRKRQMVADLIEVHLGRYEGAGVDLIMGEARFVAPRTVEVALNDGGARTITGDRVILSLGTRAAIPDVDGLADARPMTHVEALDLERVPDHLIVLGGGYVGLELAQAARRFGSRVTVVERGAQLAGREDPDVGAALLELFGDEEIDVLLGAQITRVEGRSGEQIRVTVADGHGERLIEATDLLIAAGRTPNTQGIGLDLAGIELDGRGYICVNERLETTAPYVWAVGDCAGSPQFTHVAFDDFRIVRDNLDGGSRTTRSRLVPFCMFTDPELARVGLNESEANAGGIEYRLATIPMAAVLRTRTLSQPRGLIKMLIEKKGDRILGFTVFGAEASELMATVQTAMLGQLPFTTLRDALFTHPTAAEGLTVLLADVKSATSVDQPAR